MIKTYYWTVKPNFGDLLTPLLLKRFCNLESKLTSPADSQLVMIGSILHHLPQDYKGTIAGAGSLRINRQYIFPESRVLALRGPLTAAQVVVKRTHIVLGDPGLLADELVIPQDRVYELGIVPHWSDTQLVNDERFTKYPHKVIDVTLPPLEVITQIAKCKKVVSSSLHAIILADAFSIPRRIELAPDMITNHYEGGTFKWEDYSLSIGMKFVTGLTQEPSRVKIIEVQHELFDVMGEIKSLFYKSPYNI